MPRRAGPRLCHTCRKRKLKCDETLPVCDRCKKAGLYCDRSSKFVFRYITADGSATVADQPRRLLNDQSHIADLFHTYIKELAPWYDLTDERCTFAREVAAHALDNVLLFSAIIAFAACFLAGKGFSSRSTAETYYRMCLRCLIGLLPDDESVQDGTALVATCLLRSYEILSEVDDPNRHLFGASTLLPSRTPALYDCSLLASGFWNYLREDITYSLIHKCPLKVNIGRSADGVITANNVANAMALLTARAINLYFGHEQNQLDFQALRDDVATFWNANQPRPFVSRYDSEEDFPCIKLLTDSNVAAHHYHNVIRCMVGDGIRSELAAEVCGLAMSSLSDPVVVNAYGPICFTGQWLEKASQRNSLVKWLTESQKRTAWTMKPIIQRLRKAWAAGKGTNVDSKTRVDDAP